MPGLYLLVLLVSAAGIAVLDLRYRLVIAHGPVRALVTVAIGTGFFLAWDAVGIATGVFRKGDAALLLGIDLAPELPIEEPLFLAFLCYLALVVWSAACQRIARRGRPHPNGSDVEGAR